MIRQHRAQPCAKTD